MHSKQVTVYKDIVQPRMIDKGDIEKIASRLNLTAYLEGEHELMALEQAEASVIVHIKGQSLHDVAQASLQAGRLQSHENHRTTAWTTLCVITCST